MGSRPAFSKTSGLQGQGQDH